MSVRTFSTKCCRICCATECDKIQNIFETQTENGERAVDMLEYCLQHTIDKSDCFPKYICVECVSSLIQTYKFISLYKQSEQYFVSLYQNVNETSAVHSSDNHIKIESIEFPKISEVFIKTEPEMDLITAIDDLMEVTNNNQQQKQILEEENPAHNDGYQSLSLEQHKKIQTRSYECFDCKRAFERYVDLCWHMREHFDFQSDFIEKPQDMKEIDQPWMDIIIGTDGGLRKSHICESCGKCYPTNKSLYQHRYNVHSKRLAKSIGSRLNGGEEQSEDLTSTTSEEAKRSLGERECHLCNKKFAKREKLNEHLQTHTEDDEKNYNARPYRCKVCFKRYQRLFVLKKHMRSHTGERPFECVCGGRFIDKSVLNKHMRKCSAHMLVPIEKPSKSYEETRAFDCKLCNRRYGTDDGLKKHMESHTEADAKKYNQRRHQCSICSKRFKTSDFLMRHIQVHTREKPHECESCGTRYGDKSALKEHMKKCAPHLIKESPKGPYKCPHPQCESFLSNVRSWLRHKSSHTTLIHDCEYCSASFEKRNELTFHVHDVHKNELKNFQCNYNNKCSKSFPLKYFLDSHLERHRLQTERLCMECGKIFISSVSLFHHRKYSHSDERPFACTRCPRKFKRRISLHIHMLIHSGQKPYQCSICLKRFAHTSGLRAHKLTHTGEKRFSCTTCDKSFFNRANLIKHIRIHTGEKPYKCEHCQRSFSQKGDMMKHMSIHLGPTPHQCTECGESFRLITELRKHSYEHYNKPSTS